MKKSTQILGFGGDLVKRVVGEAWTGRNTREEGEKRVLNKNMM